jgi:hypothetical protein
VPDSEEDDRPDRTLNLVVNVVPIHINALAARERTGRRQAPCSELRQILRREVRPELFIYLPEALPHPYA